MLVEHWQPQAKEWNLTFTRHGWSSQSVTELPSTVSVSWRGWDRLSNTNDSSELVLLTSLTSCFYSLARRLSDQQRNSWKIDFKNWITVGCDPSWCLFPWCSLAQWRVEAPLEIHRWMRSRGGPNRLLIAEQTHVGRRDKERRAKMSQAGTKEINPAIHTGRSCIDPGKPTIRRRVRAA